MLITAKAEMEQGNSTLKLQWAAAQHTMNSNARTHTCFHHPSTESESDAAVVNPSGQVLALLRAENNGRPLKSAMFSTRVGGSVFLCFFWENVQASRVIRPAGLHV